MNSIVRKGASASADKKILSSESTHNDESGSEDTDDQMKSYRSEQLPPEFEHFTPQAIRMFRRFLSSFDEQSQSISFQAIQQEMWRLLKLEARWIKRCPHADQYIFDFGQITLHEDDEPGSNLSKDSQMTWSYNLPKKFCQRWKRRRLAEWHGDRLICKEPGSALYLRGKSDGCLDENLHSLSQQISSQLLLYRITVIFGMPPKSEEVDGYQCCWATTLHYSDGRSTLELYDCKGSVDVAFEGTPDAETEALTLLNFLCGNEIPHTYDGILAGSQAQKMSPDVRRM